MFTDPNLNWITRSHMLNILTGTHSFFLLSIVTKKRWANFVCRLWLTFWLFVPAHVEGSDPEEELRTGELSYIISFPDVLEQAGRQKLHRLLNVRVLTADDVSDALRILTDNVLLVRAQGSVYLLSCEIYKRAQAALGSVIRPWAPFSALRQPTRTPRDSVEEAIALRDVQPAVNHEDTIVRTLTRSVFGGKSSVHKVSDLSAR